MTTTTQSPAKGAHAAEATIPQQQRHMMSILDASGDTRLEWDSNNANEVATAKAAFKRAKKNGMLAYSVDEGGQRGEVLHEFNPDVGRIVMVNQLAGG